MNDSLLTRERYSFSLNDTDATGDFYRRNRDEVPEKNWPQGQEETGAEGGNFRLAPLAGAANLAVLN
jgi:hypothetical protein